MASIAACQFHKPNIKFEKKIITENIFLSYFICNMARRFYIIKYNKWWIELYKFTIKDVDMKREDIFVRN